MRLAHHQAQKETGKPLRDDEVENGERGRDRDKPSPKQLRFQRFREKVVPEGEEGAANALRVNNALVVGARFRRTIDLLAEAGYRVVALPTDEIGKIDAGLSCMSLRRRALKDT